jgi:hypothetical protein
MPADDNREREVAAAVTATRRWLEAAVIGLNLCPFAYPVAKAGRIRYVVSHATTRKALRHDLAEALRELAAADPQTVETTLFVSPWALQDFYAFNDFLAEADAVLEDLGLVGTLQIASFHPQYQFVDSPPDDIANATNRAPYPTLHLLRESSIERAVESMPDPSAIYQHNIATLRGLGEAGWRQLQQQFDPQHAVPASNDPAARPSREADGTQGDESI